MSGWMVYLGVVVLALVSAGVSRVILGASAKSRIEKLKTAPAGAGRSASVGPLSEGASGDEIRAIIKQELDKSGRLSTVIGLVTSLVFYVLGVATPYFLPAATAGN